MIAHPSVAGAAVLAGLIVAGGGYAARHDLGLGSGLPDIGRRPVSSWSTSSRSAVRATAPPHLLAWHPPRVPKIHVHPRRRRPSSRPRPSSPRWRPRRP